MKTPTSRLVLILGLLAFGSFMIPAAGAADEGKSSNKKQKEEADLRKYDRNQNGKLDPDEKAALEADLKKEQEEKEKKRKTG
jgi:hypothetical protein